MNLKGVIIVKIYANMVFIFFKKNLLKDAFLRNLKFLELIKFIGIFDDVHFRHCFMTFVSVFENLPNHLLSVSLNKVSVGT